jgi:CBS-domain-containing membrane protein
MEVPVIHAALPTRSLSHVVSVDLVRHALPPRVDLDSPAEWVMTTTADLAAATVMPDETLERAQERMTQQNAQVLLVVAQMPQVLGILTREDLHGEKPLRLTSERRLARRDLRVADLMQPVSWLASIELRALRRASVAQVVATFVRCGQPHLLVVEAAGDGEQLHVRGLLSRAQVERQLDTHLPVLAMAGTFAEIERALL